MGPDVKYLLCVPPRNPPALKFELVKKLKFDVNETYSSIKGFRLSALFNTYIKTAKISKQIIIRNKIFVKFLE